MLVEGKVNTEAGTALIPTFSQGEKEQEGACLQLVLLFQLFQLFPKVGVTGIGHIALCELLPLPLGEGWGEG